ncbi:hypothetical protein TSAR_009724 [Trichomalopsis sarcophagae]|uniref:Uncharacterized protein n=1 Tax=Trichomalopsis sarcophagae TaxID=543379 RepID=A0A232EV01_9HYME|nr:hypothetical protein TSAR_009724 [Trichomalopsis sarcophagae]
MFFVGSDNISLKHCYFNVNIYKMTLKVYEYIYKHDIKWRGSATKASLRSRRSLGARDTIYFYIDVRIFHFKENILFIIVS